MLSLRKIPNYYTWNYDNVTQFVGKWSEVLAYGHWTYGISKDEIAKALRLLNNDNSIVLFKDNKIFQNKC